MLMQTVSVAAQKKPKPVAIIFDSDMEPDYDNAGAIALLQALVDETAASIPVDQSTGSCRSTAQTCKRIDTPETSSETANGFIRFCMPLIHTFSATTLT